jgi:hypothetical protein
LTVTGTPTATPPATLTEDTERESDCGARFTTHTNVDSDEHPDRDATGHPSPDAHADTLLETAGMPRERIIAYLDVSPLLFPEWPEAIEPMPMDKYAALLALLTDMMMCDAWAVV